MAATIVRQTDFNSIVGKRTEIQAQSRSRLKRMIVKVTVGGADTYATNGYAADISEAIKPIKTIIKATVIYTNAAVVAQYDKTNKKIVMYGQDGTGTTVGAALTELANASAAIQNKIFEIDVEGY